MNVVKATHHAAGGVQGHEGSRLLLASRILDP